MANIDLVYTRILEYMQGGALALDFKGRVRAFNPAAARMLGLSPERVSDHPFATQLFDDPANDSFAQALLDAVYEPDCQHARDIEYWRDGTCIWLNLITSILWSDPLFDEAPSKLGVVALFMDITERKSAEEALRRANEELEERVAERTRQLAEANLNLQNEIAERERAQEQLAHLADHDALTGLANRRHFEECLAAAVAQGKAFALLYLDVDKFKAVNDTHGHGMGDWLLKSVARRLESCVRLGDLPARLGGDEFAVILKSAHSARELEPVVERIIAHLAQPYMPGGDLALQVDVSVGVALYPYAGQTPRALIQSSDKAMYDAKRSGPLRWCLAEAGQG